MGRESGRRAFLCFLAVCARGAEENKKKMGESGGKERKDGRLCKLGGVPGLTLLWCGLVGAGRLGRCLGCCLTTGCW